MCGIIGYLGPRPVADVLLDSLSRLEYRGYDSAGIALADGQPELQIVKKAGKVHELKDTFSQGRTGLNASCGIGHTRWATHGVPSDANAHPHRDCTGHLAVVHNGIIENYAPLRQELTAVGHRFASETDTEVIPHLIEEYLAGDLVAAVRQAVQRLSGSYALAAISAVHPGVLVAARRDSPLVIGLGEGEYWVASDIPALLPYTRRIFFLENGEMAVIREGRVNVLDARGRQQERQVFHVNWEAAAAAKNGYPHFMLKEIFEQPQAIRDTLRGRLHRGRVEMSELGLSPTFLQQIDQINIFACGTAYHAGLVGGNLLEKGLQMPVRVELASEFRYRQPRLTPATLAVAISQSGETADTLAAARLAQEQGAKVLAITNVVGSSLSREADATLYTRAGPEIAVASTKAYVTQLVALDLLYLWLLQARGRDLGPAGQEMLWALEQLPSLVEQVLQQQDQVQEIARYLHQYEDAYFIGRGLDYAVAMEGALKLKEISYVHAESLAAGELKHGTLALITSGVPVVGLSTQPSLQDKVLSNFKEVKARDGYLIVLTSNTQIMEEIAGGVISLPQTLPELMPVLAVVPLQLLAYYVAVARGCDVDQPRNLAKSVTVE